MSAEALRSYVEELLAVQDLPGLALAVTDRDGLLASETFGHANLDARTPVTPGTYFEHGSIGKTFTAVLLMQLREEGAIDLQEPVARYLPWFEVRSEHAPFSLHHLLTHTSGLMIGADQSSDSRFDVWALRKSETGASPGARYLYSNVGYRVLGYVVEAVAGKPYPEVVQERILQPLGLDATAPAIRSEGRRQLAVGYEPLHDDRPRRRGDDWVPAVWLETGTGDGALAGTMEDLAVFLRTLLNGGRGLLAPESFDLMATPAIEVEDGWWSGRGLELRVRDGRREIRHSGSMPGFRAMMLGDLAAGLGVTVAVNAGDESDVAEAVASAALDLFRDGTGPPPVRDPLAVDGTADFEGRYAGEAGELELVVDGDRLLLAGEPQIPLEPRAPDSFLVDQPRFSLFLLRFTREDGRVVEAAHGADVYRREGTDVTEPRVPPPEWNALPGHYRAYNPWYSNFRIVLRRGKLLVIFPWGLEFALVPLPDGSFRVGGEEWWPERLRFDAIVDGAALRADFSGEAYYRVP